MCVGALRTCSDGLESPGTCVFSVHLLGPAMPRAIHPWKVVRSQTGPGELRPLVWSRASGDPAGPGTEPGRKVLLTPPAGVRVGRQRGPVSSVWERAAATTGHEIGSSGAPQQGPRGWSGLGA